MAGHGRTLEERQTTGQGGSASPKTMSILALKAQLLSQRVGDNAFHLERPAKVLEAVQTFFDHVKARRVTEPDGAIVAKGGARHDSDIGFAQQTVGEILRGESKLADVYQDIKRALRFHRSNVGDLRKAVEHVVATHIEFLAHIGERLLVAFERGKRAVLRKGRGSRTGMALD